MRLLHAGLAVLLLTSSAAANGRDPYTSSLHFKRGAESNIVAGMTFGLITSHDNGATWEWMCEQAVGYGGMYDPDYEYTSTGAVFATTFDGLKVMRDGCAFAATPPGMTFVSRVEQASDGTIYFAAADPADSKIYKSTDDGVTFPTSASPGLPNDWWQSIEVAPSNPQRVYLTGYRLDGGNPKQFLMYRSNDAGATFPTAMTMTGIATPSANSAIEIVGISPTNPDTLYIKVTVTTGTDGDAVYRSTDAGATWTKILDKSSKFGLSFLVRKDGSCVAGTRELGAWKAANCATVTTATWTDVAGAPHIGCLYENAAGEVWACTQNYASVLLDLPSDGFGIMKSTDLATWTGVLRFEDIKGPVACAADTVQAQQCVQRFEGMQSPWCCLVPQLGITSVAVDCNGALACNGILVDGPATPVDPGCCDSGSGSSAFLGLLVVGLLLSRKRRP